MRGVLRVVRRAGEPLLAGVVAAAVTLGVVPQECAAAVRGLLHLLVL